MKTRLKGNALFATLVILSSMTYAENIDKYSYKNVCPGGDKVYTKDFFKPSNIVNGRELGNYWVDKWSFAQCNCTSYVAYRLNQDGIDFDNAYGSKPGKHWSHASNWDNMANLIGLVVNTKPNIGSVAQWEKLSPYYGHVAYVDRVNLEDNGTVKDIVISEYNFKHEKYSSRILKPSDEGYPDKFIHFEDINSKKKESEKRAFFYNGLAWIGSYDCYDQNNKFFEAEKRDGGVFLKKRLFKDMCFNTKALCDSYEVPRECTAEKPIDEFDDGKE